MTKEQKVQGQPPVQDALLDTAIHIPAPEARRVRLSDVAEPNDTGASNTTVSSMELVGQLEPVRLMRPAGTGRGTLLLIIDGNRRLINAARLGWTEVDALVYPPLSAEQLAHLQLGIHNRAANPVAEARSLKGLMLTLTPGEGGLLSDEQLSQAAKMSVTRVRKLRRLLSLPDDVLELIGTVIAEGTAEAVANLSPEHRAAAVQRVRERAAQDRGRFTNHDLKEVQLARDQGTASLLAGLPVALPVMQLAPVDLLAAQVRMMCEDAQVSVQALIRSLQQDAAPIPLSVPQTMQVQSRAVQMSEAPVLPVMAWEETPTSPDVQQDAHQLRAAQGASEALRDATFTVISGDAPATPPREFAEAFLTPQTRAAWDAAESMTASLFGTQAEHQEDGPLELPLPEEDACPPAAAWEAPQTGTPAPQPQAAPQATPQAVSSPAPAVPRPTPGQGSFGPRTFRSGGFTGRRA